jgi:hypothetical protein
LRLAVNEPDTQQPDGAQREANPVKPTPRHFSRHQRKCRQKRHRVPRRVTNTRPFHTFLEQRRLRIAGAEDDRHRIGKVQPHAKESHPGKELHEGEPSHRAGHFPQGVGDFREQMRQAASLRFPRRNASRSSGGYSFVVSTVHSTAQKKAAAPR